MMKRVGILPRTVMFEWISFKDRQPSISDFIIAWDGSYYSVGEWTQHTCSDGIVVGPYLYDQCGACCHSYFDGAKIKLWAYITDPEKDNNV